MSTAPLSHAVEILKADPRQTRLVAHPAPPLADGAVRLKIELFSLTANNVTYAAVGSGMLGYWDFFPAGDAAWGRVPVWGFARVIESALPAIAAGTRFWGYYPFAETLDVQPTRVGPNGFADGAPHRQGKASVYNQYLAVTADPAYDPAYEPEQTLIRGLFATGWWAADDIARGTPAPRTAVLSSASSKTALATAHRLRQLSDAAIVGLTSAANVPYVAETGLYDRIVPYDEVARLSLEGPVTFVDFLGRRALTRAVHETLGPSLTRSITIGVTDWTGAAAIGASPADEPRLAGPKPSFFFVPTYAQGRLQQEPSLAAAMASDQRRFYAESRRYVLPTLIPGLAAGAEAWARLVGNEIPPREGLVVDLR